MGSGVNAIASTRKSECKRPVPHQRTPEHSLREAFPRKRPEARDCCCVPSYVVRTSFVNNCKALWPLTAVRVEHSDPATQRPRASLSWRGEMSHLVLSVLSISYSLTPITSWSLACSVLAGLAQLRPRNLPGCSLFTLSTRFLLHSSSHHRAFVRSTAQPWLSCFWPAHL